MQIHVVQQGETITRIAQEYQVDAYQVTLVNQLDNENVLVVGQALVIPEPKFEYIAQPGDHLWAIAEKYGVTVEELAEANNIVEPYLLYIGEMLEIPITIHTVQPGEFLWSIAQNYNVSMNQIIEENNIADASTIYPGERLRIPTSDRPHTEVNAYTTNINEEGTHEVELLGNHFTYLSTFMHTIRKDGSVTELQDEALLEAARANHVNPFFVLTNFRDGSFDSDLAAAILRNPDLQETLITNILNNMKAKDYQGLNIDFEYVHPEDKENYNAFLRRVIERLRPQGFSVSTALAPKESAEQQGLLYEAHDYVAHGEIVDFVILMTYEWGWAGGRPLAIAPVNKIRDVLDYAVTVIPRNKIFMGVPLYGRDWHIPWVQGTIARTLSPKKAMKLAEQYGASLQYNNTYQSPFYRYTHENGQEHEVWFEDARSMQAKYDTVKEYRLRGISYWVLGSPFPQNWAVLQANFHIRKV